MKFSYQWLKELSKTKYNPKKLAHYLELRLFEVEQIVPYEKDYLLDISILPNRFADCAGHIGLAREIAVIEGKNFSLPKIKLSENQTKTTANFLQIEIKNKNYCSRYTARIIDGVKIKPSPKWLQKRLEICGIQPINNVVDAANYVMLETGQPLHIFDFYKLKSSHPEFKKIIIRTAKRGEKIITLDNKQYNLDPEILVIADQKGPIAIAGIKGDKESGVSRSTTKIILESANFDQVVIHKGSRKLNLKTDASYRFERSLDPNQTSYAIDRLAQLIQQVAGGEIIKGYQDVYPNRPKPKHIKFQPVYANKLIGENIPVELHRGIFKNLGLKFKKQGLTKWHIHPPSYRKDLAIEEDLIEEVARLYGYENIAPKPPAILLSFSATNEYVSWKQKIKDLLAGIGFNESLLSAFIGQKQLADFLITNNHPLSSVLVEIENPINSETQYLTPKPLIRYVLSGKENLTNFEQVRIFAIEKSFQKSKINKYKVVEEEKLVIVLASRGSDGQKEFYELKGVLDYLFESLGINSHQYKECQPASISVNSQHTKINNKEKADELFHPYRQAKVQINGSVVGVIGQIHPQIERNIKSKAPIIAGQINIAKLIGSAQAESEYRPISKYPAVLRDISLVVPSEIRISEILNKIREVEKELLCDIDLFDYFQDKDMQERGEKSIAFHLTFQSPNRTLTDQEIQDIMLKIKHHLENSGWKVR